MLKWSLTVALVGLLLLPATADGGTPPPPEAAPAATAKAAPKLTARRRAAYGMLLWMSNKVVLMREHLPDQMDGDCPKDVEWVTWGVAKTDPWDNPFGMRCNTSTGGEARFRSAGPDGKMDTPDDVLGWKPLVPADRCAGGCKAMRGCAEEKVAACQEQCASADAATVFRVDSCALLAGCKQRAQCIGWALQGASPMASCRAFGKAAARAAGVSSKKAAKRLEKHCEEDMLRVPELLCVQESRTATEAALCHLTVARSWPKLLEGR